MTQTLLADVKTDRLTFDLPDFEIDLAGAKTLEVVHIGCPEVEETRMCAQCVGECKVF